MFRIKSLALVNNQLPFILIHAKSPQMRAFYIRFMSAKQSLYREVLRTAAIRSGLRKVYACDRVYHEKQNSIYAEETFMDQFAKEDLEEALRAINSTISKCEKVQPKLKQGSAQHTLLVRRIKALQIASSLIKQALDGPSNHE